MSPFQSLTGRIGAAVLSVLFPVLFTVPSAAQLTLESMAPTHGSQNLSTQQALILNFSQPLDTTASYEVSDGFYLGVQMVPNPGEPDDLSLSEDGKQLTAQFTLLENTQYWVLLDGAKSESGATLDRPYAWTFSTGTLPTGSISGTVSFPGSSPENAIVGLFPSDFFAGIFGDDEEDGDGPLFVAVTVVTDPGGSYEIEYVPGGTYLPAVEMDVDHNGEPSPDVPGEGFGFYDPDGDRVIDQLTTEEGEQVTDLDLEIHPITLSTAGENYADVLSLVRETQAEAELTGIRGGELTPEGEAIVWFYSFYAAAADDTLAVVQFFDYLVPIDAIPTDDDPEDPFDPTSVLPDDWIDSAEALAAAEDAGGAEYRAESDDVMIVAALFNLDLEGGVIVAGHEGIGAREPVWIVIYQAAESPSPVQVFVDALSAEVLLVLGLPTLATSERETADQTAAGWQADAALVLVETHGPIDPMGRALAWLFAYYSPSADAIDAVFVGGGRLLDERDGTPDQVPSIVALPGMWVDSDVAAAAAEEASQGYRNQHPDAQVFAQLTRGRVPANPDRALWEFVFTSQEGMLRIFVDPFTGVVTTDSETDEIPAARGVLQAYPNPSRGTATIAYSVETPGEVEVILLDVLGRTVRHLVRDVHPEGSYNVSWDGTDDSGRPVATGNYWCRMTTVRDLRSTSLTVVK